MKWAGMKIHTAVENELVKVYKGEKEKEIPGAGRADYINGNEIYEIKPLTQYNDEYGKEQLQNYVDHLKNSRKGTALLESIPKDIHIEELVLINTGKLRVTCDVACVTNIKDSNQEGMIYYIPYNWNTENSTRLDTALLVTATIFCSMAKQAMSATANLVEKKAASMLILVPNNVIKQHQNKFGTSPPSEA